MAAKIQDSYLARLAKVRSRIGETSAERDRVERAPATLDEAERRIDVWLDAKAGRRDPVGARFVAPGAAPGSTLSLAMPLHAGDAADADAVLIALDRDRVRALLVADALAHLERHGPGIAEPERLALLERLEGELLDLELDEEGLIVDAEGAGLELARRADADPRAVLAILPEPRRAA